MPGDPPSQDVDSSGVYEDLPPEALGYGNLRKVGEPQEEEPPAKPEA